MQETSSTPIELTRSTLGLRARLALLAAAFLAEKMLLEAFVDAAKAQTADGMGALLRVTQHWGFRFLVAFMGAAAVFALVQRGSELRSLDLRVRATPLRFAWLLLHAALLCLLATLSYTLYRIDGPLLLAAGAVTWILTGSATVAAAALTVGPLNLWRQGAHALGSIWLYAAAAAVLGTGAWQQSERLWLPITGVTFDLVRLVLLPVLPTLVSDPASRVLSSDRFAIEITDYCSGLEGMGLMLAFTVAWLICFRREYIFPRALLLVPAGLAAIFGLNVLRIAALMLIGDAGFPDIAAYGFHSQAGWIAFNVVACGLVFLSRRSSWLTRTAAVEKSDRTDNPTAAFLVPLLAVLAAGAVSHAMSGLFETFYPLRLVAGAAGIYAYRNKLIGLPWGVSWRAPAVGVFVFLLWAAGAHLLLPETAVPAGLEALSPTLRALWIASRVVASVITVPIAEELAYRGFLMRRIVGADFDLIPFEKVSWVALGATALLFGAAHGVMWLPGVAAGLAYGMLAKNRRTLGEAVVAHATTNACVAIAVLYLGMWQFW